MSCGVGFFSWYLIGVEERMSVLLFRASSSSSAAAAADLPLFTAGRRQVHSAFGSGGVTCHSECFSAIKRRAMYCRHANEAVATNQESTGANQEQLGTISSPAGRRVPAVAMSHQQPSPSVCIQLGPAYKD